MTTSRPYTEEELRDEFIGSIRMRVMYWKMEVKDGRVNINDAIDGVAFSVLTLLDGCADMPSFDLVCRPHPDDKEYHINNGDNWIEDGTTISDMLHERYYHK